VVGLPCRVVSLWYFPARDCSVCFARSQTCLPGVLGPDLTVVPRRAPLSTTHVTTIVDRENVRLTSRAE